MNKKWNEKTTLEKTADIISWIALAVWVVFEILERTNKSRNADIGSCIAIAVVCVCQAISYWNVKRVFSYIAIAGTICIVVALVLLALLCT